MLKVDNEEKARKAFARLFGDSGRPLSEGPNETELELEQVATDRAELEGRVIRVFKRDAQKPLPRRKGWLYREVRS